MITNPFINLLTDKDAALSVKHSPMNTKFEFKGIQLLPDSASTYCQVTNTPDGIHLEDWTVKVYDAITDTLLDDITSKFLVILLTNDIDGNPQLYWTLKGLTNDYGYRLVYMKITQTVGQTFYSNPFMVTMTEYDKTSQIFYKFNKLLPYQGIGLQVWFRQFLKYSELTSYYEVSTRQTVSVALKTDKIGLYRTEFMPLETLILMSDALENPYCYIDFVRCNIYESIEIPEVESQQNFAETMFKLSLKDFDVLDINTAGVVPPKVPTTIKTTLKMFEDLTTPSIVNWSVVNITVPAGYVNFDAINSYMKIDKSTVKIDSVILVSGTTFNLTSKKTIPNLIIEPGKTFVSKIKLLFNNGNKTQTYSFYADPGDELIFLNSEINNNTTKDLILNIT